MDYYNYISERWDDSCLQTVHYSGSMCVCTNKIKCVHMLHEQHIKYYILRHRSKQNVKANKNKNNFAVIVRTRTNIGE